MTGIPAVTVEIAFDSDFATPAVDRTWTDVSTRVDGPVQITWGRADQLGNCEPSTCSVVLENINGDFTAQNTGSAYYPNVKLDRPIRVTVTPVGGTGSVRFTGYVDGWPVSWPLGVDSYSQVQITATSRLGRLGLRNAMWSMVVENALATSAASICPLFDPAGSTSAEDVSGNDVTPLAETGAGAPLSFGGDGIEFAGGKYLTGASAVVLATTPAVSFAVTFSTTVPSAATLWGACSLTAAQMATYADGRPHRFVVTRSAGGTVTAKVDNTAITAPTLATSVPMVAGSGFTGTLRDLCYWTSELSSGGVTDDYTAFNGAYGEVSDATLERIAGYAGIPLAEVDADAGVVLMGGIDTSGMSATDALRVVETTEGGILVDARNGDLRLIGRRARYATSSTVTLDMAAQEVESGYSPTLDRSLLLNDVTGTNAASSVGSVDAGATVSRRAKNQASKDAYGTKAASVEVSAVATDEAFSAASWLVANFGEPSLRVPSLSVEFASLSLAKQQAILAAFVGDRITLSNRPAQDAASSAEFFLEGGSETWESTGGSLSWNVSPIGLEDSIVVIDDAVKGQIDAGNYIGY